MSDSSSEKIKLPEANDLLKEYKELPALLHSMVGKKYTEQVKYFKKLEESYAELSKAVKELIDEYEKTIPANRDEPVVIKMPVMEKPKNAAPNKKESDEVIAPSIEAGMSPSYAMSWVKETMRFI